MKKIISLVVVALSFGAFADSYLYWMVGDESTLGGKSLMEAGVAYAKVGMLTDGGTTYLNLYGDGGVDFETTLAMVDKNSGMCGPLYAGILSDTTASFFVELLNDKLESIGKSAEVDYSGLASYIGGFGTDKPADSSWTVSTYSPIPEPNSAMLVLLGMAALGLRRKQKKA